MLEMDNPKLLISVCASRREDGYLSTGEKPTPFARSFINLNWAVIKRETVTHRYPHPNYFNECFGNNTSKNQAEYIFGKLFALHLAGPARS